jgi:hypothetical protein
MTKAPFVSSSSTSSNRPHREFASSLAIEIISVAIVSFFGIPEQNKHCVHWYGHLTAYIGSQNRFFITQS